VKDLRGPDPVDDLDAELLAPARVDLIGQRLAGRHADTQRGEIEALLRLLDGEHAGVERRHAEEDRRTVAGEHLEHALGRGPMRVEHGLRTHRHGKYPALPRP